MILDIFCGYGRGSHFGGARHEAENVFENMLVCLFSFLDIVNCIFGGLDLVVVCGYVWLTTICQLQS